jgi:hypothetical protein
LKKDIVVCVGESVAEVLGVGVKCAGAFSFPALSKDAGLVLRFCRLLHHHLDAVWPLAGGHHLQPEEPGRVFDVCKDVAPFADHHGAFAWGDLRRQSRQHYPELGARPLDFIPPHV